MVALLWIFRYQFALIVVITTLVNVINNIIIIVLLIVIINFINYLLGKRMTKGGYFYLRPIFEKQQEILFLGSVAISAVSLDVSPYISIALKSSFFEICNVQYMQKQYC